MSEEAVLQTQTDGAGEDWKASLPEEIRNDPSLGSIKDLPSLAKSYVNAQKLVGGEKVAIPKDDADPQWDVVFNRLGRPEAPDKYDLVKPEGLSEWDEDSEKAFREQAHKLGLTTKQAKGLFDWYGNTAVEKVSSFTKAQADSLEKSVGELKSEWGQAFDAKVASAQKAVEFYGDENLKGWLTETGNGNHPALVKLFAKLGEGLKEDGLRGTQGAGLTPGDAQSKVNSILNDPTHPYHDRMKPGHREAVMEVSKLFEAMHPEV